MLERANQKSLEPLEEPAGSSFFGSGVRSKVFDYMRELPEAIEMTRQTGYLGNHLNLLDKTVKVFYVETKEDPSFSENEEQMC